MIVVMMPAGIPSSLLPPTETLDICCHPRTVPSRSYLFLRDVSIQGLLESCFEKVPVVINRSAVWVFREEVVSEFIHIPFHTFNIPFLVLTDVTIGLLFLLTDRSTSKVTTQCYTLHEHTLSSVPQIKYLGV